MKALDKKGMPLKVGSRVLLLLNDGAPRRELERGVVVHLWPDRDVPGAINAYVAFFGRAFPRGEPRQKPYVLRYWTTSLEVVR